MGYFFIPKFLLYMRVTMLKFILFPLLLCSCSYANDFDQQHANWNQFLSENITSTNKPVSTNLVDYSQDLDSYLKQLSSVSKEQFKAFSKTEKLAFFINTYNAFTIKLIQNNKNKLGSKKSIKNISTESPWDIEFINILGQTYSLNHIEHEIIRKEFNEPRIHFALVCAAISCPKLQNFAFTADKLEKQLEQSKKEFLKNKSKNYYKSKTLHISKVFEWFADDFTKNKQSIKKYVARDIASSDAEYQEIISDRTKVKYVDYDWTLNSTN